MQVNLGRNNLNILLVSSFNWVIGGENLCMPLHKELLFQVYRMTEDST